MTFDELSSLLIAVGNPPTNKPLTMVLVPRMRTPDIVALVDQKGAFLTGYDKNEFEFPVNNARSPGREFCKGNSFPRCVTVFPGHREFPGLETRHLDPAHPRNVNTPPPRGWKPITEVPNPGDLLMLRDPWSLGGWKRFLVPTYMTRVSPKSYQYLLQKT